VIALLLLGACAFRLGPPAVSYGPDAPMPLVHTSVDTRRWYLPMDSEDHGSWVWFVDTGYTYSACDDDLIGAVSAPTRGRTAVRGEIGRVDGTKAALPSLLLGGHTVTGLACQVRDLDGTSSIKDPGEVRVAGVIGMDVLRRFRVTIDPAAGVLHLRDPSAVPPLRRGVPGVTRVRRAALLGPRFRLPLTLDGVRRWPVVDTGASTTHVDGARYHIDGTSFETDVRVSGTGGAVVRSQGFHRVAKVAVGALSVGSATLTDRHRPFGTAGLLGVDLLSQFSQDYDFRRGRARLTPGTPRPLPTWRVWDGAEDSMAPAWLFDTIQPRPGGSLAPGPIHRAPRPQRAEAPHSAHPHPRRSPRPGAPR